jgi:hypothetical protein
LGDALDVFGILDAACRGDTQSTNASLMQWRDLPTHLRQCNYAQVERIGAKLREIGAALATSQRRSYSRSGTEKVERLGRAKHRRGGLGEPVVRELQKGHLHRQASSGAPRGSRPVPPPPACNRALTDEADSATMLILD